MIRNIESKDLFPCWVIVRDNWDDRVADKFLEEAEQAVHSNGMLWPPEYFVYERDGEILGFAGMMWSWAMSGVMDFIWINVKKDAQGLGVGRELTEYRIKKCEEYGVKVINLFTQKPNFFEQFGFTMTYVYEGTWFSMTRQLAPLDIHYE